MKAWVWQIAPAAALKKRAILSDWRPSLNIEG